VTGRFDAAGETSAPIATIACLSRQVSRKLPGIA
jgi:hypothetical protein